jgi:transposase
MEVVYARCGGLDVHKRTVVACVVVPGPGPRPHKEVRTFGTMTDDLLRLADWLVAHQVTHVAMESTGVYWRPIWNILEGTVELLLANAQHVKQVPGRKTDVKDAEWLADLLRHGLLRGSFVPERPQRELRDLTRYRTTLIRERAAEVNRLQKTLEGANIKLGDVASDVMGVSGRRILEALIGGTSDPATLADLALGQLRAKRARLERALASRFGPHQRFLLAQQLAHLDAVDELIAQLSAEIAARLRPQATAVDHLDAIPGVGRRTAEVLVAELGTDLGRFPTAAHLASWAGMCPGNHQSAGKRTSGRTRKGNPWVRTALVEAAHAASRTKATSLAAQYHRLVVRRGRKKAIIAVGHRILTIAYYLLTRAAPYQDLGAHQLEPRDPERAQRHLVQRLETLGFRVTLETVASP